MDPQKALPVNDSSAATHDAQRELEQRALRNVRSLVDKLEGRERARHRSSLKLLAWLVLGMAIAVGIGYAMLRAAHGPGETRVITTNPAKGAEAPR
jgi:hypothetical protein